MSHHRPNSWGISMRSYLLGGLWFLLTLVASAQELPDPKLLIDEALATHPSVRKAEFVVEAAQATLSGSRYQPNPTLTLSASAGDPAEDANILSQTFEISGQPRLRQEQALAELEAARARLRLVRRTIASEVCSNWLDLWENQHLAMLAQLRLELAQEMVRVAGRRFEVGEIPRNEALRVELAAAEAEANQKRAVANYLSSQRSLTLLRGGISPDGELPDLSSLPPMPEDRQTVYDGPGLSPSQALWSLEEVLASAESHPEVEALRQEQLASMALADLVGKERAPQIGVSLYRSRFFGTGLDQGAQLSISWPIFDWGSVSARKKAQQFQAQARLAEADEKSLELRRQVSELWNQWQAAVAVRDILVTQARRYEELASKARVGYDVGLLTLTDVLETETAYRDAGVELIKVQAEVYRLELGLLDSTNLPWPGHLLEES